MGSDWDQRVLCSDGGCVGVIGPDGVCKVCGRAAPNWGDDRQRGMRDPEEADRELEKSKVLAEPEAPDDFDDRKLCRDGGCVGVIGDDGRCKVCGLRAEPDAATP